MELVVNVNSARGILSHRGDEGGREVRGDNLYLDILSPDLPPEAFQRLLALSLTHMDDAPRVKVNNDGLVDMSLTGGELVYAYASHMADVRM